MDKLEEPTLKLVRTPLAGAAGEGAIFTNPAAAIDATVAWFEPRFWIARGAIVRQGGRGGVTLFDHGGRRFVLRQYRRGGIAARFTADRYFWLGEARVRCVRELRLTMRLQAEGLPVPVPVAARYERHGQAYRAAIITEFVAGTMSLAERLAAGPLGQEQWAAIGRCIRGFHDKGLCHADLNAQNILLRDDGAVFLIDFDRCRRRHPGMWRDANLARLRRSLDALQDRRREPCFGDAQWQWLLAAWL